MKEENLYLGVGKMALELKALAIPVENLFCSQHRSSDSRASVTLVPWGLPSSNLCGTEVHMLCMQNTYIKRFKHTRPHIYKNSTNFMNFEAEMFIALNSICSHLGTMYLKVERKPHPPRMCLIDLIKYWISLYHFSEANT